MSKYGSNPKPFHYSYLKSIAKHLTATKEWCIIFHRNDTLDGLVQDTPIPTVRKSNLKLPRYPTDIQEARISYFVDVDQESDTP